MWIRARLPCCLALVAALVAPAAVHAAWHFTDVTADAGLTYEHGFSQFPEFSEPSEHSGGVAAGDYDGDGRVDLYVVRGDIGPNLLFRNRGDGSFEEVGAAAGVALTDVRSAGPLFADLDGDGHPDLAVGGRRHCAVPCSTTTATARSPT